MAFKMFKNLRLLMTVRHICSWQHQATSRGWCALKRLLMELASHLGKKLLFPGLLYELGIQDPPSNDCWTCLKVRHSFRVPASWKSLQDTLQDTGESDWQTANIGRTVFEISYFMEKSAGYYGPVGWKWMLLHYRRTLGDYSGSKMSLSFLEFQKLLTMHFLFT